MRRILVAAAIAFQAHAQTSPAELAHNVVERWAAEPARVAGLANVIRTSSDRAVLLISGVPKLPNSGDATIAGRSFSGVYEANSEAGRWKLGARIPLEDMGQILAHHMKVGIRPGSGLTVEDRMRVRVKGPNGFGDIRLELFLSPDIQPDAATIAGAFRSIYTLLSRRFGALPGDYFGVVQARSWRDNPGWRFASNQIVVAAAKPGMISMKTPIPVAPMGRFTGGGRGVDCRRPGAASYLGQGRRDQRHVCRQSGGRADRPGWVAAFTALIGPEAESDGELRCPAGFLPESLGPLSRPSLSSLVWDRRRCLSPSTHRACADRA